MRKHTLARSTNGCQIEDETCTVQWKTGCRPNHICWDKEIVKTVQPRLYGNCKTWNTVKVNFATLETHVLGDNRLPMCHSHQTAVRHRRSHFCRPDLQFGVEEMETMMPRTTNGLTMQCTRATKFHRPINRVRHGWNRIEVFSLTHALHTDGRRLVMKLEHIPIHNNAWASHATSPQCRAECALEIHSHVNRLSTCAEDTLPLNMDSNHPNIVSASDSR